MEYFLLWIGCGIFAAIVAGGKGRSFGGWLVLGLIFGIFALLAVGFLPKVEADTAIQNEKVAMSDSDERKCPFCAEIIKAEAIVCKHCGRDVPPIQIEQPASEQAEDKPA